MVFAVFLSPSRGLYLTSIFYRDDNILVTSEDQIPIVEVEDSFSASLMQDFLWFTKVDKSRSLVTTLRLRLLNYSS